VKSPFLLRVWVGQHILPPRCRDSNPGRRRYLTKTRWKSA